MKKIIIVLLSFLLSFFLIYIPLSFAAIQEQQTPQATQQKLNSLSLAINRLKKKIQNQKQKEAQAKLELEETQKKLSKTTQALSTLNKNLENKNKAVTTLTQEISTLSNKQVYSKQLLEKAIQLQFEIHQQKNNNFFSQYNRNFYAQAPLYEYYAQAQINYIKLLMQQLNNYNALEHKTKQEKVELDKLRSKIMIVNNELTQKQAVTQKILPKISAEYNHNILQLNNKIEEQKQLEKLLKKLREQLKAAAASKNIKTIHHDHRFAKTKGQLRLPIHEAGAHLIKNVHSKFIIPAQGGTSVHAIYPGRIIFAEFLKGLKMLIIIDHGGGYMSLYGNNQALYKKTGDWVEQHEAIASVSPAPGKHTTGLYFEIRKNGNPIDLIKWMQPS